MKKLLSILLLFIAFCAKAQDVTPIDTAYHNLGTYTFKYYTKDSSVWINKGVKYGSTKLVSNKRLKFLIDSVLNVNNTKLAGKKPYHGIETIGAKTFNNSTHVFTIASGGLTYWNQGYKHHSTTAKTVDLDDVTLESNKLYFIYFSDTTGVLRVSKSPWNFRLHTFVATLFWNGSIGAIQDEDHNYTRDLDWHIWAHSTVGTRYISGLDLIAPTVGSPASLSIGAGTLQDEDNDVTISPQTTMRGWHLASAGVYTFEDYSLPYLGTAGAPKYLDTDTYTLTTYNSSKYACYWVYGSNDETVPIWIIPSQIADPYPNIAAARAEAQPNLSGLNLNPEMKVLFKLIYSGNGAHIESVDYRNTSTLPAGGSASTTAGSVSFAPYGGITSTTVQKALEQQNDSLFHHGHRGRLPFYSSASGMDTTGVFWDTTNKRIGIKTIVPDSTLTVTGSGHFTSGVLANKFKKIGGIATQFLMADGSVRDTVYMPRATAFNSFVLKNDSSKLYERIANKVTSISGSSTDIQYPSAKLVYDQLALKAPTTHSHAQSQVTALSDSLLNRYTKTQSDGRFAPISHTQAQSTITALADSLLARYTKSQSDNRFAPLSHTQAQTTITALSDSLLARYTKTQSDGRFQPKAAILTNIADSLLARYTKTQANALFQSKGNYVVLADSSGGGAGKYASGKALQTHAALSASTNTSGHLSSTDWNTFNGKAPASGSANYIHNQYDAPQSYANMWISGTGVFGSTFRTSLPITVHSDGMAIMNTDVSNWSIIRNTAGTGASNISLFTGQGEALLLNHNKSAVFASTVSATQYQSTIATGTPPLTVSSTTLVSNLNAERWAGYQYGGGYSSGLVSYVMIYNGSTGKFEALSLSDLNTNLGVTTGSGTANYLTQWTGPHALGNSPLFLDGAFVVFSGYGANFTGTNRQLNIENSGLYAGYFGPAYNSSSDNIIRFKDYNSSEYGRFSADGSFSVGTINSGGYKMYVNGSIFGNGTATFVSTLTSNADLYVKNGFGIRLYNPANTDWSYLGYNANSETNFNNTVYLKNAGGVNALYPSSTNATDLGTSSLLWKNIYYTGQLNSTIATGNPPFVVASTTLVNNLNADRWAGYQYGGGYSSGLVSYVMIYNGSTGKFEALTLSGLNTSLGTTTGSGNANYIPKWKTGTTFEDSPMSIDGNFVMFASGANFTGTNRQVIIENTGLYAGLFSPAYNSTSDNIIKFKDYNSSEYARFDASGNFAIGTTNASGYKAYINGTAYIATSVTTPTINLVTGAGVNKVWQCTNATTGAGQWASMATSQTWKGSWNASSNSPTLADGTGTAGDTYTVSVGATRDLGSGSIAWPTNGSAVYNGSIWQMLPAPTISGTALTKTDDTNVTLTLGGSPSTALVNAASITVGWTGTLADTRITSASNWNTAYNQTRQWDGGTGAWFNATTGRTSLGLGNAVTANFGTTTGTIAYGDHNHTGVYDPYGTGNSEATAHVSAHESTFNHSNYNTAFGWGNWAVNFGTIAGKIAEGNHSHDYSAIYDAIGAASTSVSTHESTYNHTNFNTAYSERMRWDGGATGLVVNTAWTSLGLGAAAGKSVGTGSTQVAAGDHNHYMVYQPYSSVLTDTEQAFTTVLNNKLTGIAAGAEVNVNADWNAVSGDAQILNKPTILTLGTSHSTAAYGDHDHTGYATTASLGDYLPLSAGSGKALTGTLYGTSASFSSTVTASNTVLSDIRLKRDIKPIEWISLENLNKVNWVQYISRNDPESRQRYGVEAQELEKILPQFVFTASDEMKTKSVNYTDLLIAKVAQMEVEKKLTDQTIKSLEERLKKLEDMFKPTKRIPEEIRVVTVNNSQP